MVSQASALQTGSNSWNSSHIRWKWNVRLSSMFDWLQCSHDRFLTGKQRAFQFRINEYRASAPIENRARAKLEVVRLSFCLISCLPDEHLPFLDHLSITWNPVECHMAQSSVGCLDLIRSFFNLRPGVLASVLADHVVDRIKTISKFIGYSFKKIPKQKIPIYKSSKRYCADSVTSLPRR